VGQSYFGIDDAPIPAHLPYASNVTAACHTMDFPPCFLYAIAWHESIQGEVNGKWDASTVVSGDGGHGLCQLTSSWPPDWANPTENAQYALDEFLLPALRYWHGLHLYTGDNLLRLVAATFNEGLGAAEKYHAEGNVDIGTTDNYAAAVLAIFHKLIAGQDP
jgi:hypothetical protein